ncbi:hypothetical protein E2562_025808 [Oryza meyeriana var. granulata]|uniref:RING-type domain-containing protein n=1 Tax=Oryza meyeriana var. granulata TaxID=110450 RepID=A0A6G1E2G4_9ORYZ|nr:hypothetical protein E2562_025808 [Oryza meyeriana var. granulata]
MRGVNECQFVCDLPEGLCRDIKSHLFLDLVRQLLAAELEPVAMSDRGTSSSVSGNTDAVPTADPAPLWAPHGRALTGCLVVVNVALVLLVYLYFWRVFSRKRAAAADASARSDDDDDTSSSASAPPSAATARIRDDVLASLPVFVLRTSAAAVGGEKAEAECAVCIAELRDGDECRALPRCGHRFHAACVDVWLRLHTTCPLCRAGVVVVAERKGGVADTTAAVEDMDAHV